MEIPWRRDWLQIAGQFGVVASLIFVGWQIQQDRDIARSATYQARSDTAAEFYWTIASDSVSRSAMSKMLAGSAESFTDEELIALYWVWRSGKEIMQNSWYQYEQGYLDEEHWSQIRQLIKSALNYPVAAEVLKDGYSRSSFTELVEEIEAEIQSESGK